MQTPGANIGATGKPWRVVATRPAPQNRPWCDLLQQQGLAVLDLPVLAIEPVQEPALQQAIKNLILNFDQFTKIIFASQNAVREAGCWLEQYWPQLPMGQQYFAIGKATARVMQEQGLPVQSCVTSMDSEELLAMPALRDVQGQKILTVAGAAEGR